MIVLGYLILSNYLGELGFSFFCVIIYFYLFLTYYDGLTIRLNLSMDFIRFGMLLLSLLVVILITLVGSYEFYTYNKWNVLLFFLFLMLLSLFFTFRLTSFLLFYLFFEFVVIPTFIIIISWGYRFGRVQAAFFMFLYTFLSSLPLLIFLILLFFDGVRLFFFFNFFSFSLKISYFYWWLFFLLVFIVKLPLFILHLWLPKAHVDAPLLGSIILAGVLLKIGGYGAYKSMIYFYFYLFNISCWLISYSIFGGLLIGIICLRQIDVKRLIAFSSVVHMGPVFCCIVLISYHGLLGSYWIMVSHGFCSACIFFILNVVYLIIGSRRIFFLRGGINYFPFFTMIWFFFCLANMGFPPTFNFFSEIIIMVGVFYYRNFIIFLFFFLLLVRGFYNIFIYLFLNHGGEKYMLFNLKVFRVKNLMAFYIFFVYLLMFVFFINFLC